MRPLRSLARTVPAALLALVGSAAIGATAEAQPQRLARDAGLRASPDGTVIGTLMAGTSWTTGAARGGFTLVQVEVWVDGSRMGGRRDSFPESIGGTGTLRMRAEPSLSGRILGVFEAGAGVRVLERRGSWTRVRRDAWVLTSVLEPATPARAGRPATAAPSTGAAPTRPVAPDSGADAQSAPRPDDPPRPPASRDALRAERDLDLRAAPGAPAIGRLDAGTVLTPTARDRGWVRVRIEAWVPESLLVPADSAYLTSLSAADLRLDPVGLRGRLVRWAVRAVSLQRADPLRRDLAEDEPYLLAMGPGGENAILYLALPPSLVAEARALAPMTDILVTARVRTGRSEPTGVPVLDVLTLTRR